MTFRAKLMLTMAPLVGALALVGIISGMIAGVLARQPGTIWKRRRNRPTRRDATRSISDGRIPARASA